MQTSEKFHSHHDDALESMADQDRHGGIENPERNINSDVVGELVQQELVTELLGNKVFAEGLYRSVSAMNQELLALLDKGVEKVLAKPADVEAKRLIMEKIEALERQVKLAWYTFGKKTTTYAKAAILGVTLGVGSNMAGIDVSDFGLQETQKSVETKKEDEKIAREESVKESWKNIYKKQDADLLEEVYKKHPEVLHGDFKKLVAHEPKLVFHFLPEISQLSASDKDLVKDVISNSLFNEDPVIVVRRLVLLDTHDAYNIEVRGAVLSRIITSFEQFEKRVSESKNENFSDDLSKVHDIESLVEQSNVGQVDLALLKILDTLRMDGGLRKNLQALIASNSTPQPAIMSRLDKSIPEAHNIWKMELQNVDNQELVSQLDTKAFQGDQLNRKNILDVFTNMNNTFALYAAYYDKHGGASNYVSYYGLPQTFLQNSLDSKFFLDIAKESELSSGDAIELSFDSWTHYLQATYKYVEGIKAYDFDDSDIPSKWIAVGSSDMEQEFGNAMRDIIAAREVAKTIEVLNKNTTVIVMAHEEMQDVSNPESDMAQLLKYAGVSKKKQTLRQGMLMKNGVNINKKDILGALKTSKGATTFIFDGHGSPEVWAFSANEADKMVHSLSENEPYISYKELAKSIAESKNSKNISFISEGCNSTTYFYNLLNELQSTYGLHVDSLPKVMLSGSNYGKVGAGDVSNDKKIITVLHHNLASNIKNDLQNNNTQHSISVQDFLDGMKKNRHKESSNVLLNDPTILVPGNIIQQKVKNPTPWMQVKGAAAHDEIIMNA